MAHLVGTRLAGARRYCFVTFVLCAWSLLLSHPALAQNVRLFEDNADSIAVVIGNKSYRQTVSVEFAHNDADAMRDFLSRSLGFRDSNIFVLKDATLSEFNQMFGNERSPQSGRLWRSVKEGYSNVFVYFSGHGTPDLQTRQPFLVPSDGNPNLTESGFPLDLLYRNLEQVKRKIGPDRQVIVMIDACFTGETGRKGESLLAASAPGFVPAKPRTGSAIVKLLATSAASPANWDQENKLGLFTSRFLLGAAGLARNPEARPDLTWGELRRFVIDSVTEGARREAGREQVPEMDEAALTLRPDGPVPAIERGYGRLRDELAWRGAETAGTVAAYENYIARCGTVCAFKEKALSALIARRNVAAAEVDAANWQRLSALEKYQEYLDGCGRVCAYRDVATSYLAAAAPVNPPPRPDVAVPAPPRPPSTTTVAARPDATDSLPVFYGNENVDFRVLPQSTLKKDVGNPTPLAIPGATTVTTTEIKKALDAGRPMILIDALADRHALTIKGAVAIPYAGNFGNFNDHVQTRLTNALRDLLRGRTDASLVFFCQGPRCWESYNAALRARAAGFQKISWYRGGLAAWKDAGFPMQPARTSSGQ